jgi:hypothetical protein
LVGCDGAKPLGANHDGGTDSAATCVELDQSQCSATSGCIAVWMCPGCGGSGEFLSCGRVGDVPSQCIQPTCSTPPEPCGEMDEVTCNESGDCQASYCPNCNGGDTFVGCATRPSGGNTCAACPVSTPCSALDESSCNARTDCQAGYCTGCSRRTFVGCGDPGTAFTCPTGCAVPGPCSSETTLMGCDTRTDCHSVLKAQSAADGPIVAELDHCADGDQATCTGTPPCQSAAPYCDGPDYVASHTASCYDGCVRAKDCAP